MINKKINKLIDTSFTLLSYLLKPKIRLNFDIRKLY
ncbi:Uncharacterised protein [Sphingobacterium mizutaii]|uniref:Uncharacterized protein n=1 Tax=Sphingobacterium mizutaii TaxID=1010 RepID=A0AAJ4XDP6_9SPHI|nr:hypothetical protein SAMN05192578_102342 [Sphingobacterium mizutaii]SNV54215.1 Uncharacterised protein [Sphingobacterium mizutaii]